MGVGPSIFAPFERRRLLLGEERLQQKVLEYLGSDDYCEDPYKHFKEIASYGYETLEEFISDIPSSEVANQIRYRYLKTPAVSLGMRYVVRNEPGKRGVLAEPVLILPHGNFATLQMDSPKCHQSLVAKSVDLLLYFFFPLRFVLQKVFGTRMLTGESQKCTFNFKALLVEKEHLLGYLLPNVPRDCEKDPVLPAATEMIDEQHPNILTSNYSKSEDEARVENILRPTPLQHTQFKIIKKSKKGRKLPAWFAKEKDDNNENVPLIKASKTRHVEVPKSGPVGTRKGIEGALNSCYLDSLLYSMFATTSSFDFLLQPKDTDTEYMGKTRTLLKEKVVTPLRETYFVDSESVMDLRIHLSVKNQDLMGAFMDSEQILYLLCDEVLKERNFIHYEDVDADGWGDFMHLMSIDASDPSTVISVQRNLETSFAFNGNIKMASIPNPVFILGMPRSDRELVHYEAVIPNPEIRVEHLLEVVECKNCGGAADWEIQPLPVDNDKRSVPICGQCIILSGKNVFGRIVSRKTMKLHAVVSIRGVHFTAFVRSSENGVEETAWYYFDSMAGGYPEVTIVPELDKWLEQVSNDPRIFYTSMNIPALVSRCLTDGHLCFYLPILYEHSEHNKVGLLD